MKKLKQIKWIHVALIVMFAFSMYSFISSQKDAKELKAIFKTFQEKELKIAKHIDSLNSKIFDLEDVISANEAVVQDLEKSQETSVKTAQNYRYRYNQLLNEKPQTVEGKLEVEEQKVDVLLGETESLGTALNQCDSVKVIQRAVITDLKEIIVNKDLIIDSKDKIIEMKNSQIKLLEKNAKSGRRKSFLKGAGVGGILVLGLILLL